jgi:hypothetical protein
MSDADYSTFNEEINTEKNLHIQCYRAMRDEYERDIRFDVLSVYLFCDQKF